MKFWHTTALLVMVAAVTPAGAATIYVTGNSTQFGSFDTGSLAYTEISTSLGGQTSGLAHHNGDFYAIRDSSVLRKISTSGVVTVVGGTNSRSDGLASNGTTLFNLSFSNKRLQTINPATGARTDLSTLGPNTDEIGGRMAFNGGTLYGTLSVTGGSGSGLYSFNTTTGASTFIGNGGAASSYAVMLASYSNAGTLYGLVLTDLYSINTTNGNLTLVGSLTGANLPGFFLGAGQVVQTVPEPSSMVLMGASAVGLIGFTRRRSNSKTNPVTSNRK